MPSDVVVVLAVAIVGIITHELAHAGACIWYRARWQPSVYYTCYIPNPAIAIELRDHTPRSFRVVSLAPLVMLLPVVGVVMLVGPKTAFTGTEPVSNALWMWIISSIPSPVDWRNVKDAGQLETLHEVWHGEHRCHRLAEGIGD